MNMKTKKVKCAHHGSQFETFVCQHIAESLYHKEPVGFFWSREQASHWPDAWCFECNERLKETRGEWVDEAERNLGAKLLCSDCYDVAAEINFGTSIWRQENGWSYPKPDSQVDLE
jgi:hypothetical protein